MILKYVLAAIGSATLSFAAVASPQSVQLAVRLHAGERIVKRSDLVDRVQWVLPPARLAAFAAQGAVINEEIRTTIVASGSVASTTSRAAKITGTIATTVRDVPRKRVTTSHTAGASVVTSRNAEVGTTVYELEGASMVDLPTGEVQMGSRWTTHQRVLTTLGSGNATFEHVVAAIEDGRVRVDIIGTGAITGKEYNLPKLLPGTIHLQGSAWFDPATGLVNQESYHIENTLVKLAGNDQIGFIERMDAELSLTKKDVQRRKSQI